MVVLKVVTGMKELKAREDSAKVYRHAEVDVVLTDAASSHATHVDSAVAAGEAGEPKEVGFNRVKRRGLIRVPVGLAGVKPAIDRKPTELR